MKRMKLIKQRDEKDCGAASLAMILAYYGRNVMLAQVREAIKVDQYGANIYGVINGAKKYGLCGEGLEGSSEEVWEAFTAGQVKLPAIVRILNEKGFEHFVVVASISKDSILLYDPDKGKVKTEKESFLNCCLGQVIEFAPSTDFQKRNDRKGESSRFFALILSQKKLLLGIAVLSLLVTAIGLSGAYIFQYIIDGLADADPNLLTGWLAHFRTVLGGLIVLYLFRALFQFSRGKLLTILSMNLDLNLILGYFNHVTGLPLQFFETRKNGEITSRLSDAGKIRDAFSNATLTLMIDVVMVVAGGIMLARKSLFLFSIALIIFGGYAVISALCIRPLDKLNRNIMEQNAEFSSYVKESIDGMETVKAAQAEEKAKEKTRSIFQNFIGKSISASLLTVKKDIAIELITSVGNLVILCFGVSEIIHGNMTVGSLITFNTLLSYFLSPIENIVELQGTIQSAIVAVERLNDVLTLTGENQQEGLELSEDIRKIEFKDVDFRYGNRNQILNKLTVDFHGGERVAIVGESGSGKSTLVKLLQGMYTPEAGDILINDIPLRKISLSSLRRRIAYVSQNIFLFSGSIRENLLLGLAEKDYPTDEKISSVLEACGCAFVFQMPLGIYSALEENGANLSGGQKQRLAIARAILRYPSVLLLDEATSALDTVTESEMLNAIDKLLPDTTIVMIAHRLSTVRCCDKIFVLENGRVCEHGTHVELLAKKQAYSKFWNRQYGNAS